MITTSRERRASEAGFTLLEVLVVASILVFLLYGVSALSVSGHRANRHVARATRAMELNQEVLASITNDLEASVELFDNDTRGAAVLGYISRVGMPDVLGESRLPTASPNGVLVADSVGNEITGNQLLFARLAWADEFTTSAGNTYRVDIMRWMHYHLTDDGGAGFELVRWVGEPLADGGQIGAIEDSDDKAEVLLHLRDGTPDRFGNRHDPCIVVWDRTEDMTSGQPFQQILDTGLLDNDPEPFANRGDTVWVILPDPGYPEVGFFIRRQFAVVDNDSLPAVHAHRHGIRDDSGAGFPHGFEVQMVGPSSARVIMLRLAIFSRLGNDPSAWSNLKTLVHVREQ